MSLKLFTSNHTKSLLTFVILFFNLSFLNAETDAPIPPSHYTDEYNYPPMALSLRQNWGNTIAASKPYTTLECLSFTPKTITNLWPFIDIRLHRFSNNNFAANAGLGARYLFENYRTIMGANIYYDYERTRFHHFNQIGIGFELFRDRWRFRINGYIPVGSKKGPSGHPCIFNHFNGNFIAIKQLFETNFKGIDCELERVLINSQKHFLRLSLGIGPYYYFPETHCRTQVLGGRICVRADFLNWFNFIFLVSNDSVFDTRIQAQIGITIPFWRNPDKYDCKGVCASLFQPVRRTETIVRGSYCRWKWNW